MNPSKTVDANGWTVYNFGAYKMYIKGGFTAAIGANGYGTTSPATLPVGKTSSTVMPVGISLKNGVGQVIYDINFSSSTTVNLAIHSVAGVGLTVEGTITFIDA